jgi:hypothetical protein
MTTTPDFAALWAGLREELGRRRKDASQYLNDCDGADREEWASGRVAGYDDVIKHMDLTTEWAARYADLDARHVAAMSVLGERSIELGPGNDLSLDQIEALAEVVKTWEAED